MGALGALFTVLWFTNIFGVKDHPRISQAEVETIERGGGLVNTDANASAKKNTLTWATVKMLLSYRMLVGVYIGQYCITTLTWFFLTWFPLYLAQARHMSVLKVGFAAAVPGLCGGFGGILGGFISDELLQRGCSLSFSRKLPIMAGMALSMTIIACNYASSQTIMLLFMSISFFGKGIGALGWTVISDTSPKGMVGMNGALFNLCGNIAGVTTPLIIGYIVEKTHSYNGALVFVARHRILRDRELRTNRWRNQAHRTCSSERRGGQLDNIIQRVRLFDLTWTDVATSKETKPHAGMARKYAPQHIQASAHEAVSARWDCGAALPAPSRRKLLPARASTGS